MIHPVLDEAVTYDGRAVPHYKSVPEGAEFPYLTTGPTSRDSVGVQTSSRYGGAQQVTVQVNTFSTKRNDDEVSAIQSDLAGVVHDASWSPSTGAVTRVRYLPQSQILKSPDPQSTFQGISEFEFRIQLPTL